MSEDGRIVYGARCAWWDGIEKVGKTKPEMGVTSGQMISAVLPALRRAAVRGAEPGALVESGGGP